MFGECFYWVFNMSIIASVMGLFVLIIRKIKFIPYRVSVFLWVVPFIRMCIPFALNSPYSLMTLISLLTTKTVTVYHASEGIEVSTTNTIMAADSYFPIIYKANILSKIFEIAAIVWLTGALGISIALLFLYIATKREIREAQPLERQVFLSDKIESPAVYGIIHPTIILPASYADQKLKYVLQHERTHIRRHDNLWRLLGFLITAVHWFNPLSWIFLKAFLSDLELACDETVIARYNTEERKEYARALIDSIQGKSLFASAFGGAKIRTRIENILSFKQMTIASAIGFALLILLISYALLTNAG